MNFDHFNSNSANRDKAFKVSLALLNVMSHMICSDWSGD